MTGYAFVVVALVCLIQIAEGNIIFGITNATRQKLAEVLREVAEAQRESTVEVNAIENLLERYVDVALIPLEKEVKHLRCKIKKAEKASKENGVDISHCAATARKEIARLDREEVRECILANDKNIGATFNPPPVPKGKEIITAEQKLEQFTGLLYVLRQAPNTCANKGILANNCVLAIINASREMIMVLQNEISVILRHTNPELEGKCIYQKVNKIQDHIDKITDKWNLCLQRKQPQH